MRVLRSEVAAALAQGMSIEEIARKCHASVGCIEYLARPFTEYDLWEVFALVRAKAPLDEIAETVGFSSWTAIKPYMVRSYKKGDVPESVLKILRWRDASLG
jgi:hypothetical protein